jgi:hypothetical protein
VTFSGADRPSGRRPLLLLVGAVVLVILGIGAGLIISGHGDGGGGPAASPSAPAASSSVTPAASASPATWANDVTFYDIPGGLRMPRSASAGPHTVSANGALASGFAHSPQGALMAAINITDRIASLLGAPIYEPTIKLQVVGDGKTELLADTEQGGRPDIPKPGERVEGSDFNIAGWRLISYTDTDASLEVLSSTIPSAGSTLYAAVPIAVRWADGDWRVVVTAGEDWTGSGHQVTDLGPFVLFGTH